MAESVEVNFRVEEAPSASIEQLPLDEGSLRRSASLVSVRQAEPLDESLLVRRILKVVDFAHSAPREILALPNRS